MTQLGKRLNEMKYLDYAYGWAMFAKDLFPFQDRYTYKRKEKKIGRNDLCPCGSGKKYKKCCEVKIEVK